METTASEQPELPEKDDPSLSPWIIGGSLAVIAFFAAVYGFNVVAFARDSLRGDQLHWVEFVLIPYERGEMSLFEAITFEYASLSHSHIPTLVVFLFSYEFLDLSLDVDRVVGYLALATTLYLIFRHARSFLGLADALLLTAFASSILFRSSSTVIFGWSLLQFQMLYVLIAVLYLRSFVHRYESNPLLHASLAMPATLLLGDSIGVAAVGASLVLLVLLRIRGLVGNRPLFIYFLLLPVQLVLLEWLFRGQRVHGGRPLGEFLTSLFTDTAEILESLYYGVATFFVALDSTGESGPLLDWRFAPLWFAVSMVVIGIAVVLLWQRTATRHELLPVLLVFTAAIWTVGVVKARLWLAGPEALQAPRYAAYTSLAGIGLVVFLAARAVGRPRPRRALAAFIVVIVVFNGMGSWSLTDHDVAVARQQAEVDQMEAFVLDEEQGVSVRGGRCERNSCLRAVWFLYDEGLATFADGPTPEDWERDLRGAVFDYFDPASGIEALGLCEDVRSRGDDELASWAVDELPLSLAAADGMSIPVDRREHADRLVVRALRSACGSSTEPVESVTPTVGVTAVDVVEGTPSSIIDVEFTLPTPLPAAATVDWSVVDADDPGVATIGSDVGAADGTIAFERGQTSQTITIEILGDTIAEGDEEVLVLLQNPSDNIRIDVTAFGLVVAATIVDDD